MISGAPQGLVVGPIKVLFNEFFCFILVSFAHKFADDNTLSSSDKIIENTSESESETVVRWFKDNHMVVNSGKFLAIIFENANDMVLSIL